jgi:hypothetical protein
MLNLGTESEAGNKTWQQAVLINQHPEDTAHRCQLTHTTRHTNCEIKVVI